MIRLVNNFNRLLSCFFVINGINLLIDGIYLLIDGMYRQTTCSYLLIDGWYGPIVIVDL